MGYTEAELSILIVSDDEMARLNRDFRHVDGPTDVLAFPMGEGEYTEICPSLLGDVVISAPTAEAMAAEHDIATAAVLDLLLVHGILHLIGHGHEGSASQARIMEAKTVTLLEQLGHSRETFHWYSVSS